MAKKLDKVDAVVVGTGWAGGVVAAELTKAGYNVVGLERGAEKSTQDYVGAKDELRYMSRKEMMLDLNMETITSRKNSKEEALPVRTQDEMMLGTNLGGASVHWAGATYRYMPYDFEIYTKTVEKYGKDKIPNGMTLQDWGITYDEMQKYYDKWEKTAGISGEKDPLEPERLDDYPNPPTIETPNLKLFKEAAKELGYNPYQIPSGNVTTNYENPDGERINQCQYCAFCTHYGCDFGAKSDPLVTVIPTAQKTGNYDLRVYANARRVTYDGKKATGVIYTDVRTGEDFEQPADVVVLAGFTYTNNRILMLSDIGKKYDPKTKTGVIGRNFHGQFNSTFLGARGFFEDKKFNLHMGGGALGATFSDLAGDNLDTSDLDFIHGGGVEIRQYGDGPINNNPVPKGTPTWGEEFKEKSLHYHNRSLQLWYTPAVMPWEQNYLDLDPTYKDAFGDPLLRITYDLTDQDKNVAKFGIKKCAEVLEKMGADIIDEDEVPEEFDHYYSGQHYAGGVIMGENPETSAVNTYLQMWDAENLFVVGASAFPHFGPRHPTATVGALAYRAAEGIEKYFKEGGLLVKPKDVKFD